MVSWDSEQERQRSVPVHISHLALSTQRNEESGGAAAGRSWDLPSACRGDGAWGIWGMLQRGRGEDLGQTLMFITGLGFWSPAGSCSVPNGEEGAG